MKYYCDNCHKCLKGCLNRYYYNPENPCLFIEPINSKKVYKKSKIKVEKYKPKVKEKAIENGLIDYIKLMYQSKGVRVRKFENAGVWNDSKKFYLVNKRKEKGWADIDVLLPDMRILFIECKSLKGKLTQDQIERHSDLISIGHKVFVINSLNYDAVDAIILQELKR